MPVFVLILLALLLSSCADNRRTPSGVSDAEPIYEPYSKSGNSPYREMGRFYVPLDNAVGFEERGIASWYGPKFHGKRTSSGEIYDMYQMTAAHKTLPLPTYVSVTNVKNKKEIVVRVNDRGPFIGDRIIDLSYVAAVKLDLVDAGTGEVKIKAITPKREAGAKSQQRQLYIQVGAFRNKNYAQNLKKDLKKEGFDNVDVHKSMKLGSAIYYVRVGPVKNRKKLDRVMNNLESEIDGKPIVVSF